MAGLYNLQLGQVDLTVKEYHKIWSEIQQNKSTVMTSYESKIQWQEWSWNKLQQTREKKK